MVADLTVAAFLAKPGTHWITVFYAHRLTSADPDDDKFVSCVLWANVHYLWDLRNGFHEAFRA